MNVQDIILKYDQDKVISNITKEWLCKWSLDKMMCDYIDIVIIKLLYNDSNMSISYLI